MGELSYCIAHVIPAQDTKDHDLVSGLCWCNPVIEIRAERITLYHHLMSDRQHEGRMCHGPLSAAPQTETSPAL